MKNLTILAVALFLWRCKTPQSARVKFEYYDNSTYPGKWMKAVTRVPRPIYYQEDRYFEVHYLECYYVDSAIIYITSIPQRTRNDSLIWHYYLLIHGGVVGDTVYAGKDKNSRLWKEVVRGKLRYGFNNVSPDKEREFLSAIESMQTKRIGLIRRTVEGVRTFFNIRRRWDGTHVKRYSDN